MTKIPTGETKLLTCPVRGELSASSLAKDGVTATEESRRVDFLHYLVSRGYPPENIAVESVVIKNLGESGRNKLRADVIVYDCDKGDLVKKDISDRISSAILVAEIKRDSKSSKSGISNQLEPALVQMPRMDTLGVYWDDVNRAMFTKKMVKKAGVDHVEVEQDDIANLPKFGSEYKSEPITIEKLAPPTNLVSLLFGIANIMRSHGINDESMRYRETVKLILARYCDEREARSSTSHELSLQVLKGKDPKFLPRVEKIYETAAKRYVRAKTLFGPKRGSELPERTLREVIKHIQGVDFTSASNETMQQVFMSFVPSVFKKSLDQYFTPIGLIETMISFAQIGPNDTVLDPAMGTADFLTAAMEFRSQLGDDDIVQRIFGADFDQKAYDLAVVNMILNKDGQSNLKCIDSIERHKEWGQSIDVALCNPPFGEKSTEKRSEVLRNYDLGKKWVYREAANYWEITSETTNSQHLGILFIERCFKALSEGGRMAIILPEGYLCTQSYGYIRSWILANMRIVALIELPRRIFTKSDADLRGNIVLLQKLSESDLVEVQKRDYPIYTDIIRRVGFKMGKGFRPEVKRDTKTGLEIRNDENEPVVDSDFVDTQTRFKEFVDKTKVFDPLSEHPANYDSWRGAKFSDVQSHPSLDLKARRLSVRAIENINYIKSHDHVRLSEIAEVVDQKIDISKAMSSELRLVEGIDIRAVEGLVTPQYPLHAWEIVERKQKNVFPLSYLDIVVGLVRPERRNIGLLLDKGNDIVAAPDGVAIVRLLEGHGEYFSQYWLFQALRQERTRLQLWTGSGGTSYGKLNSEHINSVVLEKPTKEEISKISTSVEKWAHSVELSAAAWNEIGTNSDRYPIINSPIFGLEPVDDSWS